jgi:hypothetical protein
LGNVTRAKYGKRPRQRANGGNAQHPHHPSTETKASA